MRDKLIRILQAVVLLAVVSSFAHAGAGDLLYIKKKAAAEAATGIQFRSFATSTFVTQSPVVTVPTGTQDGDLMIAVCASNATHVKGTGPAAGWTQIGTTQDAATDSSTTALWHIAASEGATVTLDNVFVDAEGGHCAILSYSGVNTSTPIDNAVQGQTNATYADAGPITSLSANSMIVSMFGSDPAAAHSGTPDNTLPCTERVDSDNAQVSYLYAQDHKLATPGTETQRGNFSESDTRAWFIVALKPL